MRTPNINFHKAPNKLYYLGFNPNEIAILGFLLSLSNNKIVHPSRVTIGKCTGMSKRTVDRTIKGLVSKGFLEYNRGFTKNGKKISNEYNILIEKIDPGCVKINVVDHDIETNDIIRNSIENYGRD